MKSVDLDHFDTLSGILDTLDCNVYVKFINKGFYFKVFREKWKIKNQGRNYMYHKVSWPKQILRFLTRIKAYNAKTILKPNRNE